MLTILHRAAPFFTAWVDTNNIDNSIVNMHMVAVCIYTCILEQVFEIWLGLIISLFSLFNAVYKAAHCVINEYYDNALATPKEFLK